MKSFWHWNNVICAEKTETKSHIKLWSHRINPSVRDRERKRDKDRDRDKDRIKERDRLSGTVNKIHKNFNITSRVD